MTTTPKPIFIAQLQSFIWPVPHDQPNLTVPFYAELEQGSRRLSTILATIACIMMALITITDLVIFGITDRAVFFALNIVAIVAFVGLALQRFRHPDTASHVTAFGLQASYLSTSLIFHYLSEQNLLLLLSILLINLLIGVTPWSIWAARAMLALNIVIALLGIILIDPLYDSQATIEPFFAIIILFTAVLGAVLHSFLLHQRWLSFSAQHKIAQLNTRLTQRTTDLEQANDQLKTQNGELDAFAHTVAHDLKTPLGGIIGYAEILHEELEEDVLDMVEARDLANKVVNLSLKSASIVNELLLLSSVRRQEIETNPINMASVVEASLQRLAQPIQEHAPTFIIPTEWPTAVGYAPWLEEVWTNYISNAIKYGGRPCEITLGADILATDHIQFWVQDNGPGLTADQQAQLFTEFSRLHQTKIQGHGLGLSIVRRIIDKLGGSVWVTSTVGEGSRFHFTLPS